MTLDRYIFRRLLVTLGWVTALTSMLVVPPIVLAAVARLGGVSAATLIAYLPFQLVELCPYLIPVICLLTVTSVYGNLSVDREWSAMSFAGRHPARGLAPALVLAAGLCAASCVLLTDVFPELRFVQRVRMREAGREALAGLFPGQTEIRVGSFALIARRRVEDTLFDVIVRVPEGLVEATVLSVHAREVALASTRELLTLHLAEVWVGQGERQLRSSQFDLSIPIERLLGDIRVDRNKVKYLRTGALQRRLALGDVTDLERLEFTFEIHRRWALGTSAAALVMLGLATGLRLRGSVTLPAIVAAITFGLVHLLASIRVAEGLGRSGRVEPALAAWSANLFAGLVSLLCLRQAVKR